MFPICIPKVSAHPNLFPLNTLKLLTFLNTNLFALESQWQSTTKSFTDGAEQNCSLIELIKREKD